MTGKRNKGIPRKNRFRMKLLSALLVASMFAGMFDTSALAAAGDPVNATVTGVTTDVTEQQPEGAGQTEEPGTDVVPVEGAGTGEVEQLVSSYATVAELEAAFAVVGEILDSGDVEGGIAALDEYIAIYNRLSPEDQAANAEALAAAVAYKETLKGSLEGIPDPDIQTLALISGESFTINVVKVVNGNAGETKNMTRKCLQSTGHSGYNHSENIYKLGTAAFGSSCYSGDYKGYSWSKYTTVPSSYKEGRPTDNNYGGVHYNITGSAPYKADETLYLFYETTPHTIFIKCYDENGSLIHSDEQTDKYDGDSYNVSAPTLSGYTKTGTINYSGTMPNNDITINFYYKSNVQKVTLTYNANGGVNPPDAVTQNKGSEFTVKGKGSMSRDNYTFLGWSTDSKATEADIEAGDGITLNVNTTLYAVWKANEQKVTLTYDGNNSNIGTVPAAVKVNKGSTVTIADRGTMDRNTHNFRGWSTTKGSETVDYYPGTTITLNADTTLYAVWGQYQSTLMYHSNDGQNQSGGGSSKSLKKNSHTYNVKPITDGSFTSWGQGKTFLGWNTKADGTGTTYQAGSSITFTATSFDSNNPTVMDLYAMWESAPINASYAVEYRWIYRGTELKTAATRTGTVGSTVSTTAADESDITYNGHRYTFVADETHNVKSDTLAADGSTKLVLYFERDYSDSDDSQETVAVYKKFDGITAEQVPSNFAIEVYYDGVLKDTWTLNNSLKLNDFEMQNSEDGTRFKWTMRIPKKGVTVKLVEKNWAVEGMTLNNAGRKVDEQGNPYFEDIYAPYRDEWEENNGGWSTSGSYGTMQISNSYTANTNEGPNLSITKSANKRYVKVNDTVEYTIEVTNNGTADATNVVVTDKLPAGLTMTMEAVDASGAKYENGTLTWKIDKIKANGGIGSVTFTAKVTKAGDISNTAKVDEGKPTEKESTPVIVTGVNMAIKTEKRHTTITVDEKTGVATIPYEVKVTNNGDDLFGLDIIDKLTEVKVTDEKGNDTISAEDKGKVVITYTDVKVDGISVDDILTAENGGTVTALERNVKFESGKTVTLTYNIEVKNNSTAKVMVALNNTAMGGSWATDGNGGRMFRMARNGGGYDITDSADDKVSVGGSSASVVIPPVTPEKVTITVQFVDEDGTPVGPPIKKEFDKGSEYDVTEEAENIPDGYEPGGNPSESTTGTAEGDKTITVPVKKNGNTTEYTITVQYRDEEGNAINGYSDVTQRTTGNGHYDVSDKQVEIDGYTFKEVEGNKELTGTVTVDDTIVLVYTKDDDSATKYTITIQFVDENGTVVKTETVEAEKDTEYDVTDKAGEVPDGYDKIVKTEGDSVKGTADGDKKITVTVGKNSIVDPTPTPTDPTPTPGTDPTPTPGPANPTPTPGPANPTPTPGPVNPTPVDPTPVNPTPVNPTPVNPTPVNPTPVNPTPVNPTPVNPTPVAANQTPVQPTTVTPPEADEPQTEIDDNANPLAEPRQSEQEDEVIAADMEIDDGALPLAEGSGRKWALVNFALMNLAVFESLMLLIGYFVSTKKESEKEEEEEKEQKKKGIMRLISLPVAILSVIAFCLTEDITLPTGFLDRWTILMAVIVIVQTVVVALSRKKEVDKEEVEA